MQDKTISPGTSYESLLPIALRFAAYTIAIFLFTAALPYVVKDGDITVFRESGPVEWAQFGLLVCSASVLFFGSFVVPVFREIFLVVASVSALAAVRESDSLLDALVPWCGWYIGFVLPLCALGFAYINRHKVRGQIAHFAYSHGLSILWAGFIIAVPIAQLMGHGTFLESLMGDDYRRSYKRVVEESAEIIGYLLLLAGSIELVLGMKMSRYGKLKASATLGNDRSQT